VQLPRSGGPGLRVLDPSGARSDHGLHVTAVIMVAASVLALVLTAADRHLMSLARASARSSS